MHVVAENYEQTHTHSRNPRCTMVNEFMQNILCTSKIMNDFLLLCRGTVYMYYFMSKLLCHCNRIANNIIKIIITCAHLVTIYAPIEHWRTSKRALLNSSTTKKQYSKGRRNKNTIIVVHVIINN